MERLKLVRPVTPVVIIICNKKHLGSPLGCANVITKKFIEASKILQMNLR